MAQIIQYMDTPLIPGEEYQLTFNADITEGILVVKQGTTTVYQSDHLYLGEIGINYENIYLIDYIYIEKVSHVGEVETITVSEDVHMEMVYFFEVASDATVTDSFTGLVYDYIG